MRKTSVNLWLQVNLSRIFPFEIFLKIKCGKDYFVDDFQKVLETKANKHSVATALHRKANKKDIEEEFKKLIRNNEFDQIIQLLENKASSDDIERLENMLDEQVKAETIEELHEIMCTKADKEEIDKIIEQQNNNEQNKGQEIISKTQAQFSSLTENINEQFDLFREDIYGKLSNKLDSAVLMDLSTKLSKKADNERVNTLIAQHKNNLIDILENYKKEFRSIQDIFEQKYQMNNGKAG